MEIDLKNLGQSIRYKLLTALVVPRPIAWVSTLGAQGQVNIAPYSFFNVLGNMPPLVALGPGYRADGSNKDTPANIERNGEFVVNMVDRALAEPMHQSAAPLSSEESEAATLGIELAPSQTLRTPGVKASKVRLECRHEQTLKMGGNQIVFGVIGHMHVADGLLDEETYRLHPDQFFAVGRLQGPGRYCTTTDQFDLGSFPKNIGQ
jgi:flavin reductase (DIM6/NTAB) family NADH-FMN oxidoreductase RutF